MPTKRWIMIDPEGLPAHDKSAEDTPCYAPRGDFLIGLAQEALDVTKRRKLEKEIAVIRSALKGHEGEPKTRRIQQLKNRLDQLKNELNSTP